MSMARLRGCPEMTPVSTGRVHGRAVNTAREQG